MLLFILKKEKRRNISNMFFFCLSKSRTYSNQHSRLCCEIQIMRPLEKKNKQKKNPQLPTHPNGRKLFEPVTHLLFSKIPNSKQSQGKPISYMLSPNGGKRKQKNRKKKKHMKEAQSPKNVESGENLYRCDPSTGHRGAVCLYPYRSSSLSSLNTGPVPVPPVP